MKDNRRLVVFLSVLILVVVVIASLVLPPRDFSIDVVVEIPTGATTGEIADLLFQNKIIRSTKIFELMVRREAAASRLKAGFYQFERPLTIEQVVWRLSDGVTAVAPVKLTVPEGLTLDQLAALVEQTFPDISAAVFAAAASSAQGFLFPDTYLLPSQINAAQLVKIMRANFDRQILKFKSPIENSGHSLAEVIGVAALVEEETGNEVDRQVIAGILWKRLAQKMRLEVDVATSTYKTIGLPKSPIVSPGLQAIAATLTPRATPYWFYLSDKIGNMHYAKTFAEHQVNIDKYLKK